MRIGSVPAVESLPSIKAFIMELFRSDPTEVLGQLMDLRRTKAKGAGSYGHQAGRDRSS
jgi:hypothetical protein